MNDAVLALTWFLGTFAAAFLLTGYMSLIVMDQDEIEVVQRKIQQSSERAWIRDIQGLAIARGYINSPSRILNCWRTRPNVRRLFYVGLCFLIVTVAIGQFASMQKYRESKLVREISEGEGLQTHQLWAVPP